MNGLNDHTDVIMKSINTVIVSPPYLAINDRMRYGGTEKIVYGEIREFSDMGYKTTLLAPKGSKTPANLIITLNTPLWYKSYRPVDSKESSQAIKRVLDITYEYAKKLKSENNSFIIHSHLEDILVDRRFDEIPNITTVHQNPKDKHIQFLLEHSLNRPVVLISKAQRSSVDRGKNIHVVFNGLNMQRYNKVYEMSQKYGKKNPFLLYMGRIAPDKRPDVAIKVAMETNTPLVICGREPLMQRDKDYFDEMIKPYLELFSKTGFVKYVKNPGQEKYDKYLAKSLAVIAPSGFDQDIAMYRNKSWCITYREAFGMVFAEANAAGKPVIGTSKGAGRDLIEDGKTGYIADTYEKIKDAIYKIKSGSINPEVCRRHVEKNFSTKLMAEEYAKIIAKTYTEFVQKQKNK